jgi:hypothetical protein
MADYASIDLNKDSKNLGNYSTFQPSVQNKVDVAFQPDTSTGFYSILSLNPMGGNGIGYDLSGDSDTQDISGNSKKEKPIYSIGTNPINGFFIGSVTVLGLFVLYRLFKR